MTADERGEPVRLEAMFPGLRDLVERSDAALGAMEVPAVVAVPSAGVLLTHADNNGVGLSGFGLAHINDDRAVLRAFVHPWDARREREIIGALTAAMEAKRLFEHGWLRIERVLRPETRALPRDMTAMYESIGFEFFYVEYEMHRDLRERPPEEPLPPGIEIMPWTRERDAAVRETYNDAFRDRGFAGFDEDDWSGATFSAQDGFRADLSLLALEDEMLAGFCLCESTDDPNTGWIDTVGVRPPYRGRGVASALMARSMAAMRAGGLEHVALRVNKDNARARRLYDGLGFVTVKKHVVYRKRVG
jgi:mycothiol synthase